MHIYAFGSVCRGEIDNLSDIDLLAITEGYDKRFDTAIYSIYSYNRLSDLWEEGNPFAWHLASEAKIIFSSDGENYLETLGSPMPYRNCLKDCEKFYNLYCASYNSICSRGSSIVFELSTIFLAVRNFATCFLLGNENIKKFSRRSALQMEGKSVNISPETFDTLERARILSIRGAGEMIKKEKIISSLKELPLIKNWMSELLVEVEKNERI